MKNHKFIKNNNLPPKFSVLTPLTWWLVLERFSAPGWVFGLIYTLIGLVYISEIWRLIVSEAVDLLGNDPK